MTQELSRFQEEHNVDKFSIFFLLHKFDVQPLFFVMRKNQISIASGSF